MSTAADPIPDPTTDKAPRRRRWIPLSLRIFVFWLMLLAVGRALMPVWNNWTMKRFLQYAHDGDIASCKKMLAWDPSVDDPKYLFQDDTLRLAAERGFEIEPGSFRNYVTGRQRFRVHLAYANDHSLTIEWGKVSLGGAFWIYQFPPPDFTRIKAARLQEPDDDRWPDPDEPEDFDGEP